MTRLRTNPRREKHMPGKAVHYDQTMRCTECGERRELAGSKRPGGKFICRYCVQEAAA